MANITQPWLEDLSEEWIPQDTPNTIARPAPSAADAQSSQNVAPKQRSRLPRMRQSSTSFSEIQVQSVANQLRPPKQRSALAERSLSENNIPPNSSPEPSNLDLSRSASHALSVSQSSDLYNGTVAHHTVAKSPTKEKRTNDTPEWKRRLVKGELGYGDQTDLFGNTGLQNIFQKPNEDGPDDTPAPNLKLGLLKGLTTLPSSPPPWPPTAKAVPEVDHTEEYQKEQPSENEQQGSSHVQHSTTTDRTSSVVRGPSASTQTAPRTVSGQIEFENESFSPVYLTTNLKVGNTPKPTPNFRGSELANRLRQIGSPPPSQYQSIREETFLTHSQGDSSLARLQDESLPEGLPAGTPDIADVGRFVELRRGGYSRDGSFRRRPLSPSPQRAASSSRDNATVTVNEGMGQEQDIQTSRNEEINNPRTPNRRAHQHLSPERAKISGSPLKLFDAHDTFTSNRLQRRLSQLEHRSDKDLTSSAEGTKKSSSNTVQAGVALSFVEEASIHQPVENDPLLQGQPSIRVESFGQGQLNQYQFSEDFTFSSFDAGAEEDSAPDGSPSLDIAPPGSRQPFKFLVEESPVRSDSFQNKRRVASHNLSMLRSVSRPKFYRHVSRTSAQTDDHSQPEQEYTEGKRGPTSPFKNPIPKRRRTIHLQEDEELQFTENEVLSDLTTRTTHQSHVAMQSVIGRKRKDARHESNSNVADAETLARRHILRPRNPTPSQRRRDELEAEILEATEAFMLSSPKLNAIHEQLESSLISDTEDEAVQAAAIASKVAAFSMNRQKPVKDDTRKRSVTTQDFLDEAVKIMHFIRTKGRPSSGLGSLEETEAESKLDQNEETRPSSSLTFDRPPSREGRHSGWKEPNKPSLDPDVMNHLRKFQEKDNDTFLNSSVNSIHLANMKGQEEFQEDSVVVEQDDIRITDDRSRHRRADENRQSERFSSQPQTNDTQPSTRSSLAQTVATSASRRSDHVATLAPEAVAHLIPEEVAGMTFDKEKNIWVRQKSPMKRHQSLAEGQSALNESEEDPFGNIPDLTVDEIVELEAVRDSPARPMPTAETILEDTEKDESAEDERPVTREGKGIPPTDTSSVPSKVSNFAWSYPKTETRATSWSTQAPRNWSTQKAQHPQTTYAIPESEEDDIEHEIKYFEGRGHAQNSVQRHRVRDITVSFAERTALDEQPAPGSSTETVQHRQTYVDGGHSMKAQLQGRPQIRGAKTIPLATQHRPPLFTGDGDLSLLDELPSKNYRMQLSMNIAAPVLTQRDNDALLAPSSPVKGDVTFMLSDLPEFTLNQVDECELPDRVVIKHNGTQFSKALEDRYAQGTADLVRALQDVEPDEPYWEDLRQVDLHNKGLSTLHRLDELCYQLEELDVSDNAIGQVKGIPYTMRRLHVKNNSLTGLTSWTMLGNLQYLDISGNDIDSLDGLAGLIHLRVLRVNNNKISSLEGITHLDGLMEVNAGDNSIEFLDFSKSNMKSLTDLDLRGNRLLEVRNLHRLPRLEHLNLNDNEINEFPLHDGSRERCQSLRSLKLCRNGMQVLDVNTYFPKIETLHVDGNCLIQIPGLDRLRHLRTLSAREQVLSNESDDEICVGNLFRNSDVRNLYVSLNQVPALDFSQHLLNLQRLELASMGLKQLPDDFGQLTPNIRSVNLNFNSIKDLRPLLNIKRLNELLLVGNKLERLRANAMVLGKLTTLSKLDWRDNPLTLRFYPSAPESRVMSLRQKPSEEQLLEQFVLPAGDIETDTQHLMRLDFETRIRRRVTEMMLANLCRNLRELDGLPFDKARVLVKDDIWDRMLLLGVIQRKQVETSEDEIQ